MRTLRLTLLAALAAGAATAGCNDFLAAPSAINNPNNPTSATNQQRLTGVETNITALLTGDIARTIALFMNQYAGTDRQYFQYSTYQVGEDFTNGGFATIYGGGGITDLRSIESTSDAAGDSTTAGIARVLEALEIGTAADFWGNVPYTTAFDPQQKATLDPQASIYTTVQALLDRGIRQLQANVGGGPGASDLFYSGDRARWIEAANTLKARFYLHTAERQGTAPDGTPAFDPAAYQSALAAAQKGISTPNNDLRSYQGTAQTESNLLYQFAVQQRFGYASPSQFLVSLMSSRNDPRLSQYFTPATGQSSVIGAVPGNGGPGPTIATFNTTTGIGSPGYRWRLVSYAENQLIIAESQYRLGNTAAALSAYNAERSAAGVSTLTSLPTGAAGLGEIITEKYIALVQNPEVWNDYKRTCLPVLTPNGSSTARIPSRFLYPDVERNANPENVPVPGSQAPRNPNDPNPCVVNGRQVTG